jgi:transcriptional regulator with XRE-family HTH domain
MRTARQLSLSQLATNAGIAKSNLSRIEQGNGNPTIDTIWRLALELKAPFSALVAPMCSVIAEDGVEVQLLARGSDTPNVDAYKMSLAPHTRKESQAHTQGATETITMISGELTLGLMEQPTTIKAGQSYTFNADQAHLYQTHAHSAVYLVTIIYQNKDQTHD